MGKALDSEVTIQIGRRLPMKLSIIVPVGILGPNLAKLIRMVEEAIYFGNQVIIINDLKDSETPKQLEKLSKTYKGNRLIYRSLACGGPGEARNKGLDLAESEWVTFWDCDDIPNIFEFNKMINEASDEFADVALGRFQVLQEKTEKIVSFPELPSYPEELASAPGIWRFAFKKTFIANSRFPKLYMGEDQVFLGCVGLDFAKIHKYQGIVYTYCLNPGQVTSSKKNRQRIHLAFEFSANEIILDKNVSEFKKAFLLQQYFSTLKHGLFLRKITTSGKVCVLLYKKIITIQDIRRVLIYKGILRDNLL